MASTFPLANEEDECRCLSVWLLTPGGSTRSDASKQGRFLALSLAVRVHAGIYQPAIRSGLAVSDEITSRVNYSFQTRGFGGDWMPPFTISQSAQIAGYVRFFQR